MPIIITVASSESSSKSKHQPSFRQPSGIFFQLKNALAPLSQSQRRTCRKCCSVVLMGTRNMFVLLKPVVLKRCPVAREQASWYQRRLVSCGRCQLRILISKAASSLAIMSSFNILDTFTVTHPIATNACPVDANWCKSVVRSHVFHRAPIPVRPLSVIMKSL